MKVFFICNKSPYPRYEGGPIAMNRLIEGMLEKGHEVKVLAINSRKYQVHFTFRVKFTLLSIHQNTLKAVFCQLGPFRCTVRTVKRN